MTWDLALGSAFQLPLRDECIDVVVADPPYEGRARGKRRISLPGSGYVGFVSREWFSEAMRVLRPSGHLYVVCSKQELLPWLKVAGEPTDIISWFTPNSSAVAAYWRRSMGGRAPVWRPILHYQKPPKKHIEWPGGFVPGNHIEASQVQSRMHEALPYPNQMPLKVLTWLLAPHHGIVLDLFSGTGTTGAAASYLGLPVLSIDLNHKALELGRLRRQSQTLFSSQGVTNG